MSPASPFKLDDTNEFDDESPTMVRPVPRADLEKCRRGEPLLELDAEDFEEERQVTPQRN